MRQVGRLMVDARRSELLMLQHHKHHRPRHSLPLYFCRKFIASILESFCQSLVVHLQQSVCDLLCVCVNMITVDLSQRCQYPEENVSKTNRVTVRVIQHRGDESNADKSGQGRTERTKTSWMASKFLTINTPVVLTNA